MTTNPNANPTAEKQDAYEAAVGFLSKGDGASLRYAALELRRCIEAVIYEKLVVYGDVLPERSLKSWQPDKAFDALVAIEPFAEETRTFAVAPQTEPGTMSPGPYTTLGVDERPKLKWIKKQWQKLGSQLHAEWPFSTSKGRTSPRAFLEETLTELAPFVKNTFTIAMKFTVVFDCSACGQEVKALIKSVEVKGGATCLHCGIHYRAEKAGESFTFFPIGPSVECECGKKSYIPQDDIKLGYQFSCRSCKRTIEFVGFEWNYRFLDSPENSEEPASTEE